MIREPAWRLFAGEYNDATLELTGEGERAPSYVVTPLGAKVNRIFVVGVITDVENVGTDMQPMWRARVSDPTGTFHVYAGQYQPEAAAALSKLKPPVFGAVVGKSRVYSPEPGTTYTSIRPEVVKVVDEGVRDFWILEACRSLRRRLDAMAEAQKMDPLTKEGLVQVGVKAAIADGIVAASAHYGKANLSQYMAMLAEALRYLLPEHREYAPPEAIPEPQPSEEAHAAPPAPAKNPEEPDADEEKVLGIVASLDKDGKGAPWEGILDAAGKAGVTRERLEETINSLLDKGLLYEPVLGRMKKI
jgi:RPA family protein